MEFGGIAMLTHGRKRLRLQIYMDVLRTIHVSMKTRGGVNRYRLERDAGLTHNRLKEVLAELQGANLIDQNLRMTQRGYEFLSDVSGKVIPVLEKYQLSQR